MRDSKIRTIGCAFASSMEKLAENARRPGKSQFIAFLASAARRKFFTCARPSSFPSQAGMETKRLKKAGHTRVRNFLVPFNFAQNHVTFGGF